ncbi:MAG TPA: nuclear transport factor 2 family protein [Solirubrobacterales bacterium]|nr:nuclear transport factor 2 family protein [Solirubrobacterales bacterium]
MVDVLRPQPAWASECGHTNLGPAQAADAAPAAADRDLVAERIARYGWSYDERDAESLGECFTVDGTWQGRIMGTRQIGPFRGRKAIVEFLTGFWDEQADQRRHVFTNVVVDSLDGDRATAHAYLILLASSEERTSVETAGPYRFEAARDDGIWRLTLLAAGFDVPF